MNSNSTIRVTALWAFSEAFLGGILHGFKIPFTGLVLAFIATLCITVIAISDKKHGAILNATLCVVLVKFVLSPYTPPMAYVAVLIQGLAGELLFIGRRFIKVPAFILAVFSQLYSAFQFLFTMTVIFGKNGWVLLDQVLNKITKSLVPSAQHYSLYLVVIYLSCYFIAGIVAGFTCISIINKIRSGGLVEKIYDGRFTGQEIAIQPTLKKRRTKWPLIIGIIAATMLLLSYFPAIQQQWLRQKALGITVRALLVVSAWILLVTPLLKAIMARVSKKYASKKNTFFSQVINVLPEIKHIVQYSWNISKTPGRFNHLKKFISIALWITAYHEPDDHHTNGARPNG